MGTSKMTWHILATFFIVSAQFQDGGSHTLYIKPTTVDTNTAPLCQRVQDPCLTLSDYLQSSNYHFPNTSNTDVVFLPGNHTLSETVPYVRVANISNISLTGNYDPTSDLHVVIHCRQKLSFVFTDVSNLRITQISFVACGAKVPQQLSNSVFHPRANHIEKITFLVRNGTYAALVFANVHALGIQNVTVLESDGYGILGLNVLGNSSIVDSAFLYSNGWQTSHRHVQDRSNAPFENKVLAGGNAMLLYCDTVHNPQSDSLSLHSMYISNVTFAHGVDTTIPEYRNISYYVQGGASGFILEMGQDTYKLNVTIHRISLLENFGEHVAGGFIHDFGNALSSIQISQCQFVNGKGLHLQLWSPKRQAYNEEITISDCVFRGNKDTGLYIESLLGKSDFAKFNRTIVISNSQFSEHGLPFNTDHKGTPAAFKVDILIFDCVNSNVKLILDIVNCSFHHNMVSATGVNVSDSSDCPHSFATTTKSNVYMAFDSCLFHSNIIPKYSVLYISLYANTPNYFDIFLQTYLIVSRVHFSNVSFHHNSAPNSIIHINFTHHIIFTNCVVSSNMGTGISAKKSIITFQGNNTLANNSGIDGGAVALEQSLISLRPQTRLHLISNRAKHYGGGIFQRGIITPLASFAVFNLATRDGGALGVCSIQLYGWSGNVSEVNSLNAFIMMDNNTAEVAGDSMYGALLEQCYLLDASKKFTHPFQPFLIHFSKFIASLDGDGNDDFFLYGFIMLGPVVGEGNKDFYTSIIKIKDVDPTKTLSTIVTAPYKLCPCSGNDIKCNVSEHQKEIQVYPGETFYVSLTSVGQFNNPSPATIFNEVCLTSHRCLYSKYLHIGSQQRIQSVGRKCENIPYTISTAKSSAVIRISIQHETLVAKASKGSSAYIINVKLLPCPFGFQLSTDPAQCKCTKRLALTGIECDINTRSFNKPFGSWIGTTENNFSKSILFHRCCPFNFCKDNNTKVSLESPDEQCAFNHSGILCGACKPGLSLALGSSQCLQCPNTYLLLITPFALAGVGLVLMLLKCNLTVSVGTINGLIFYANIVRANQAIFFPHGTSSSVTTFFSVFIAWVNLDMGIETCFFHGMDANVRAWLQFVFPIYVCGIAVILIILSQYFSVVSKLTGSNAVSVLATLFLLSYAKILRSVIAAASFTYLVYSDETQHAVWLHDGNIHFFTTQHLILFGFAIIVCLLYIVPLTIIVVLAPTCLQARHSRRVLRWLCKLRPLLDAYQQPYKDKFRHWPGALLMVRIVLFVTFACNMNGNPSLNLVAITVTVLVLLLLCWNSRRMYKNYLLSVTESFFYANLGILSSFTLFLTSPPLESEHRSLVIVNISVGLSFVAFCVIMFYHCYHQLNMTFALNRIVFHLKRRSHQYTQQHPLSHNRNSGMTTLMHLDRDTATECTVQKNVTFSVIELSELSPSEECIQHDAEGENPEAGKKY